MGSIALPGVSTGGKRQVCTSARTRSSTRADWMLARLAHEPSPVIEVACSKCEWKGAFSRAELLAMYGAECPLPTLLNHLAMPGCSKITPTGIGAASTMSTQSTGANGSSRSWR
jgi:hypothetical protein